MSIPEPVGFTDEQTSVEVSVRRFTVLTVNTHKGFTALNRRFILPELREAVRSVAADVVFLQEVHGTHEHHPKRYSNWPTMPQYEFLADSLWPQFAYGRNAVYPEGDHGNALLSKFQIIRHDNLDVSISGHENRGLLHCVLRLPGDGVEVHAICVHLGLRESHRNAQLKLLGERLAELPDNAPVIVAGDFNDWRQRADALLNPAVCARCSPNITANRRAAFRRGCRRCGSIVFMYATSRPANRKSWPTGPGHTFPTTSRYRWRSNYEQRTAGEIRRGTDQHQPASARARACRCRIRLAGQ